jgi:hypothetical protein
MARTDLIGLTLNRALDKDARRKIRRRVKNPKSISGYPQKGIGASCTMPYISIEVGQLLFTERPLLQVTRVKPGSYQ